MRNIRLFVSSPSDVSSERQRVKWIADRLSGEFAQSLRIETILWEDWIFNAHETGFQPQIERRAKLADCDIVLAIFWSRLGTPLPDDFPDRMPDGKPYPSGTAYEVLSALEARKANEHRPDVFVFRKNIIPTVPINDKAARDEADRQWERLEDFFARYFELADKRIVRVVEKFRETGEFERKVGHLLRDWIKSNVSQGTVWSIEEKGSPFRGLEPFDARHADVYCGRDRKVLRAIDELLSAARRGKPLLLIPGASGSGKSSLMRAGMAPRLVRPGTVGGVDLWRTAVMRPATDGNPMLALARSLFVTGDEKKDDPGGFGKALPELAEGAFKTPERLAQLFAGAVEVAADPIVAALDQVGHAEMVRRGFERPLHTRLLLLVDQFEDIFAAGVTPEQRLQFANLLAALVNTQRVWAVATLRGDMYERMITERSFVALKDMCGQFDLGPPGPDELDEIVHRSADAAGLEYEERKVKDDGTGERWERLDDRLMQDAAGENTLPLLQFALILLFEKCWGRGQSRVLTLAAYEEIGGLDGAINQTAETALARLVRPGVNPQFPLAKDLLDDIDKTINPVLEGLLRKLVMPVGRKQQGEEAAAERALTAQLVPIEEARRDEPTGWLIDALLQARILLASQSAHGSWLCIAHDRVITSWDRARVLTEKNRDFYRVKDAIEHQRQRWEESNLSAEFLIPAGAQITQGEEKVKQFPDEFSEATRAFVALSSRRARFRQRLMTAATVVFAVVAVIATLASFYAAQQQRKADENYLEATTQRHRATENYEAARDTVGGLVTSLAQKLRDREGIRVETIEEALKQVAGAVVKLEAQNEADPELKRIRAAMHFEFAKAFQNSRALDRALEEAKAGLAIRKQLAALPSARRAWLSDHAESLDQVGDIHRARKEFGAARTLFDRAHAIRVRLHAEEKDNLTWMFALSQSLVRIGDLKVEPEKNLAGAKADYQNALQLIIEVVKREPDQLKWQRELSWDFNKVGDILLKENKVADGLAMYEMGLRTRRYIASQKPMNTLYKRDVAFTLEKIGKAKYQKKDFQGANEVLFEVLQLRQELIKKDPSQTLWLIEFAETLDLIGKSLRGARDFKAAAGFFMLAAEKLERLSADRRAKKDLSEARKEYLEAVARFPSGTQSTALTSQALKRELKRRATEKMNAEIGRQRKGSNPVSGWNAVKASLLRSPLVKN
jgi:hypothetical protein